MTVSARKEDVAKRRETLLGTNQYPNFREQNAREADPDRLFRRYALVCRMIEVRRHHPLQGGGRV